jgi:hypothetical protein
MKVSHLHSSCQRITAHVYPREPLMITGRAVSALPLHHRRCVVVRRDVNYDFAGPCP